MAFIPALPYHNSGNIMFGYNIPRIMDCIIRRVQFIIPGMLWKDPSSIIFIVISIGLWKVLVPSLPIHNHWDIMTGFLIHNIPQIWRVGVQKTNPYMGTSPKSNSQQQCRCQLTPPCTIARFGIGCRGLACYDNHRSPCSLGTMGIIQIRVRIFTWAHGRFHVAFVATNVNMSCW